MPSHIASMTVSTGGTFQTPKPFHSLKDQVPQIAGLDSVLQENARTSLLEQTRTKISISREKNFPSVDPIQKCSAPEASQSEGDCRLGEECISSHGIRKGVRYLPATDGVGLSPSTATVNYRDASVEVVAVECCLPSMELLASSVGHDSDFDHGVIDGKDDVDSRGPLRSASLVCSNSLVAVHKKSTGTVLNESGNLVEMNSEHSGNKEGADISESICRQGLAFEHCTTEGKDRFQSAGLTESTDVTGQESPISVQKLLRVASGRNLVSMALQPSGSGKATGVTDLFGGQRLTIDQDSVYAKDASHSPGPSTSTNESPASGQKTLRAKDTSETCNCLGGMNSLPTGSGKVADVRELNSRQKKSSCSVDTEDITSKSWHLNKAIGASAAGLGTCISVNTETGRQSLVCENGNTHEMYPFRRTAFNPQGATEGAVGKGFPPLEKPDKQARQELTGDQREHVFHKICTGSGPGEQGFIPRNNKERLSKQELHKSGLSADDGIHLIDILEGLVSLDENGFFSNPLEDSFGTDHLKSIRKSNCFSYMRHKIHSKDYRTWRSFVDDFEDICNCGMSYKERGSSIWNAAHTLLYKGKKYLEQYADRAEMCFGLPKETKVGKRICQLEAFSNGHYKVGNMLHQDTECSFSKNNKEITKAALPVKYNNMPDQKLVHLLRTSDTSVLPGDESLRNVCNATLPCTQNMVYVEELEENRSNTETILDNMSEDNLQTDESMVEILKCTGDEIRFNPVEQATECSSSFGDTEFDSDNDGSGSRMYDAAEVESELRNGNGAAISAEVDASGLMKRKKALTLEWKEYRHHIEWRCQWLQLRIRELSCQASKYNHILEDIQVAKAWKDEQQAVKSFTARSSPLIDKTYRHRILRANSCQLLEYLDLSGNLLTDKIPPQLMNCSRLVSLALFSNFLEGSIPSEIGRLSMLQILDVSRNSLTGKIPKELADCRQLSVLVLSNLLNFDPGNDTDVDQSSVFFTNSDKGEYNYFEGIPASIFTLPHLQIIWAPKTSLSGPLPENWDNCNLQVLNLGQNLFTGQIPAGLGQCKNLFFLDLSSSHLTGEIPQELRISCLIYFDVSHNSLTGNFTTAVNADCPKQPLFPGNQFEEGLSNVLQSELDPPTIYSSLLYCGTCASSSLRFLVSEGLPVLHDFSGNNFTGSIPPPLIGDQMIKEQASYALLLNDNNFTGNITSSLFNLCARLQTFALNMSVNQISGEIPPELFVNCKSLKHFEAAVNQITGPLPSTLGNLESLMHLDLRKNSLHGSIPTQFGRLKDLRYLSLGENNLTGEIPGLLGQISLTVLELYSNAFTGKIPANLINLKQLTRLRLDNNKLTGQVPQGFANLTSLTVFNVSYNNLSGPLPQFSSKISCDSFTGNNLLQSCVSELAPSQQEQDQVGVPLPYALSPSGNPVGKHSQFNSIEIAAITSAAAIVSVVLVLAVLFQCTRWHIPSSAGYRSRRREVITFTNIGVQLTYESVVRATGNFSAANFIGNGGFGATYKAELIPGLLVAVKRLSVGRFQGIQQFDAEIRTLGRARHPNLVTLIGYHVSESQMFLVYNYLPGGNLEKFLQERSKRRVDWSMIHKIALDIARALTYLHEDCVPRVLHRDIKPSNILLDNNFNAYLSDFGLARLLGTSETHATTDVAGTFGYVAPEYAMTCRVSDKADVYSYGVVLLELLSDKKALDPSFSSYGNGFNIVAWACMLLRQGRARELFTAGLWDVGPHDDLIETLHLAVMCTVDSLSIRPSMKQVVQRLRRLQPPLLH